MSFKIVVDEDKCIGCGECKYVCPKGGLIWDINEKAVWCEGGTKNTEYCHACTNCVMRCSQRIISAVL